MLAEVYIESRQTSKMECFTKIVKAKFVHYFRKTLHRRFWKGLEYVSGEII